MIAKLPAPRALHATCIFFGHQVLILFWTHLPCFFSILSVCMPGLFCSAAFWLVRIAYCRRLGRGRRKIVSGYVCNHGSPSGERDTASPRGRYGERPQRDSVWRYIWKNTTCWPATAHDVTTGVPQYKCRREDTSSASSSEACVRSMAQSPGDAVSRSPLGEPWLHT